MATEIASLLVSIGVSADGAEEAAKDLKNVKEEADKAGKKGSSGFSKFAKSAKAGFAIAAVAAVAAAAAIAKLGQAVFSFVDETTTGMDKIAKDAKKSGLGVEEFQRLGFVAERSGTNIDTLGKATRKLGTQMLDVAQGGGQIFADALGEVGLSIADLEGISATEQLGVLGDALNGVDDIAKRTALTARLLGEEAGPALATLLGEGTEGIKALSDAATGIIPDDAVSQASAFQDDMTNFKGIITEVKAELATALIPVIKNFLKQMKVWIGENKQFIKQDIPKIIKALAKILVKLLPIMVNLVQEFQSFFMQIRQLDERLTEKFGPAWKMVKKAIVAVLFPIYGVAKAIGFVIDKITEFISSSKELMKIAGLLGISVTPRVATRGMAGQPKTPGQIAAEEAAANQRVQEFLGVEDTEGLDRNAAFKRKIVGRIVSKASGRKFTRSERRQLTNIGLSKKDIRAREKSNRRSRGGGGGGRRAPKETPEDAAAAEEEAAAEEVVLTPIQEFLASRGIVTDLPIKRAEIQRDDVKPQAILNITNNTFNNEFDIKSTDPIEAGKQVALAVREEFDTRLSRAGQAVQGNVVR